MKAFDRPVNHFMLLISFYSEHIENKKFSVAFRGYKKAWGVLTGGVYTGGAY